MSRTCKQLLFALMATTSLTSSRGAASSALRASTVRKILLQSMQSSALRVSTAQNDPWQQLIVARQNTCHSLAQHRPLTASLAWQVSRADLPRLTRQRPSARRASTARPAVSRSSAPRALSAPRQPRQALKLSRCAMSARSTTLSKSMTLLTVRIAQ